MVVKAVLLNFLLLRSSTQIICMSIRVCVESINIVACLLTANHLFFGGVDSCLIFPLIYFF